MGKDKQYDGSRMMISTLGRVTPEMVNVGEKSFDDFTLNLKRAPTPSLLESIGKRVGDIYRGWDEAGKARAKLTPTQLRNVRGYMEEMDNIIANLTPEDKLGYQQVMAEMGVGNYPLHSNFPEGYKGC